MLDSGRSARRRFSTSARFHVSTPPSFLKQHAKDARWRSLLFMLFLSCTLFVTVLNGWPASSALAFGFSYIHSTKPTFTLAQFLKEGQAVKAPRGPFVLPQKVSPVPGATKVPKVNLAKLPPNAEPANMKPIHQTLSLAFLHGGANVQPLDLKGSDGRLEVQLAPGTFDLSHALNAKGKSFQGSLILSLTQVHGHFVTSISVLGCYQLMLTDMQGHTVTGIRLHAPITILYHYQPWEMTDLGLDPGHLVLSWPAQLYAACQQHTALPGGIVALHDNAKTHTLTGKMIAFMPGAFDVGGGQVNQSPPVPHMASTMGNSGQFSYSYPLQRPPAQAARFELPYRSQPLLRLVSQRGQ